MRVPKLMQNFLKNMGFCHSYDTSRRWLRENAASDRIVLADKVRRKPMAVVWDNLVRMDKKAEETLCGEMEAAWLTRELRVMDDVHSSIARPASPRMNPDLYIPLPTLVAARHTKRPILNFRDLAKV
jgi:hypothetical protein